MWIVGKELFESFCVINIRVIDLKYNKIIKYVEGTDGFY